MLGGNILGDGVGHLLRLLRFVVLGEGVVQVEGQGARSVGETLEGRLGFPCLLLRHRSGEQTHAPSGLRSLDFEWAFFCSGFLTGEKILPNTDAIEPTGHAPGECAVAVFELSDGERGIDYA